MNPKQPGSIRYEDASEALPDNLPELRDAYQAELIWWDTEIPSPHVVYGDVLNPYLERLVRSGDEAALRRAFSFLEILSCSEDTRVQEIVAVTVCEGLSADERLLNLARRYMGTATRKISDEVEKFWNG